MRPSFYLDEMDVVHELRQTAAGGVDRQDPVFGALDDEQRDVDPRQVGAEVR